jgi:hypothetical protein
MAGGIEASIVVLKIVKQGGIEARALRTLNATSGFGYQRFVLAVEDGIFKLKHQILANPLRQFPNRDYLLLRRSPVGTECGMKRLGLLRLGQSRNQQCVASGQSVVEKRLGGILDQIDETEPTIDVPRHSSLL